MVQAGTGTGTGTGTGKSLTYLIPAVAHAFDTGRPAVVATATLTLQAQIGDRDMPHSARRPAPRSRCGRECTLGTYVAEVVVFSNDFARRRERPRRPWATSTRQACRMRRNTGCLSSHPDPAQLEVVVPAERAGSGRGDPTVHQDQRKPAR